MYSIASILVQIIFPIELLEYDHNIVSRKWDGTYQAL